MDEVAQIHPGEGYPGLRVGSDKYPSSDQSKVSVNSGTIRGLTNEAEKEGHELQKLILSLGSRLEPIMATIPPEPSEGNTKEEGPSQFTVARSIRKIIKQNDLNKKLIRVIMERLEL